MVFFGYMNIAIRKSVPGDVYGIRQVTRKTWLNTYPNEQAGITVADIENKFASDDTPEGKQKIEDKKRFYADTNLGTWVAEENGTIVGFCSAGKIDQQQRVLAIYVLPAYQGKGIGSPLLTKAINWFQTINPIFVNVAQYNTQAISFYLKHGFRETGISGTLDPAAVFPSGKIIPEIKLVLYQHVQVKQSPIQGQGVYAIRSIKIGEVVLVIDDTHVVTDESTLTKELHEFDCDYLANGKIILMQEPEKFINHSCDPTSYIKTINGVRTVLAMRDVAEGEEITFDYCINGDNEGTFECHCGAANCRKIYNGNFFKLPIDIKQKYLPYLDKWFVDEHQTEIIKLQVTIAPEGV